MQFHRTRSRCLIALLAIAALSVAGCDDLANPDHRPKTAPRVHYGDFVMRLASVQFPDTVVFGDTLRLAFTAADGEDPCGYANYITVWFARILYLVPWGVYRHGESCRPLVMSKSVDHGMIPVIGPNRRPDSPIYYRLVVCQTAADPIVHDVVVTMPWPTMTGWQAAVADSLPKPDPRMCRWPTPPN
jgi:hypothetical protein